MITRNALGAIALATTCLAPLAAFAQNSAPAAGGMVIGGTPFTGEIGIGVMGVMGNNPDQAGRYNGLNTSGIDFVGNFDLGGRSAWDSGATRYYELIGNNLVFQTGDRLGNGSGIGSPNYGNYNSSVSNDLVNSGSLEFRAGDQGTWEAGVNYNSITYTGNVIDSLYSVNGGQATLNPGLIPFGGANSTNKGVGTVNSFTVPSLGATGGMQPVQVGTRRDIIGADFKYIWGDWTFSGAFQHEHKEGSVEESFDGAYQGTAFAMPVDYDTDRYDATAAYTTHQFQGSLQYTFSHFSDNNTFVALPYPIGETTAPYQRATAYATPPSNEAHYVTLMLGSNAIPNTRLNLNARVGVEKQDDTFAPNTADPNPGVLTALSGLNGQLQGTTANSLDAIATVYQLKVSAASDPFANLDTRVYYGLDGRSVSLNQSKVVTGGTGGFSSDSSDTAANYEFVVPQDWLKQNAGAEVGYRILPAYDTKLTIGYRLDDVDRSNAQVGHSSTNTATIALTSELGPDLNGRLAFEYADRSGTLDYLTPWQNLNGPQSLASATYSGAYYQAPMTSEAVNARVEYTPMHSLSGSLFVQFKNENYNYPAATPAGSITSAANVPLGEGIKQDYALSLGPDIDWRPSNNVNIHFFYTYELLFYNNLGNGACSTPAQIAVTALCAGSAGYFSNQDSSATNTVGVSGEWKINEKLKLRGDYTFSYGSVMFSEYNGVFVANPTASYQNVANYPDINSVMQNVKLTATYELTPAMELSAMVAYTSYHDNNWNDSANAIQGAGTTAISYLTPGYGSPNYSVVMLMTGIKFKF
jgi:MtrB/PioB family decaheme-associated outer membrane protein